MERIASFQVNHKKLNREFMYQDLIKNMVAHL